MGLGGLGAREAPSAHQAQFRASMNNQQPTQAATMVINPTYLAQKTRTCMMFKLQTLVIILISSSRQLAGRPAESYQSIPGMATICELL